MKTVKNNNHRFSAKELKEIVLAAQKGDQIAINTLCKAFEPLIKKEARRSYILQELGEDAVNTAWVIFLSFIQNYNKTSYLKLPGLLKMTLRYELFHKAFRKNSVTGCASLDTIEETCTKNIAISDDKLFVESIENKSLISYLLSKLTDKQKEVIEAIYIQDISLNEYRLQKGISFKVAYMHKQAALKKMFKILTTL